MSITIGRQQIEQVKYTKFLGLFIDDEVSWKYHINHVIMKIISDDLQCSIIAKLILNIVFLSYYNLNQCSNLKYEIEQKSKTLVLTVRPTRDLGVD